MKFNNRLVYKMFAWEMLFLGAAMLIPCVFTLVKGDYKTMRAFLGCALAGLIISGCLFLLLKKSSSISQKRMLIRDGYLLTNGIAGSLILMSALPYFFCGRHYSFLDSWFMSASAWTTTGATALDLVTLPDGLLLWRGMNFWFGGFSILLAVIMLFQRLGINEQGILSGPQSINNQNCKVTAQSWGTIRLMMIMYVALSLVELVLLMFSDMPFFYAVLNVMSNISTSGMIDITGTTGAFVITPYIQIVMSVFVLLASINFFEYYYLIKKRTFGINYEVRVYMTIIVIAASIITVDLLLTGKETSIYQSIVDAVSMTISHASTSGFATEISSSWPSTCKFILFLLMIIGGCSMSAASGMKVMRVVVFWKLIRRGMYKRIHPRSSKAVIVDGHKIMAAKASSITVFILLFYLIVIVSSVIVSLDGESLETTFYSVFASITNTGTFGGKLATGDFRVFCSPVRFYLSLLMITGRLGIYPIAIMFAPSIWRNR